MESFILRVYRRDKNDPENMVGTVEDVGTQEQAVFHSMNGLQRLLSQTFNESLVANHGKPEK
ncbi:MAG: hypothetical protein V3W04_07400 [Gammaproteobacteria bacterium]